MRNFLESIKTFIIELIGLVGGIVWGFNSNWDYEPIILMACSGIGLMTFFILKFIPDETDKPVVELQLIGQGSTRHPPQLLEGISPTDESGQYYMIVPGGIYLFRIEMRFKLIVRANSKNNAYNLTLLQKGPQNQIVFKNKINSLEPLTIQNPISLDITYTIARAMTHEEAEAILKTTVPQDLMDYVILAKYSSESRKQYFTRFIFSNQNEVLRNIPDFASYRPIH